MARVFEMVDGEGVLSTISFITPSGIFIADVDANELDESQIILQDEVAGGRVLETLKVNLYGSSQDNAASQRQALTKMLRKAWQFWNTSWQRYPVYIKAQHTNETNPRYSIVYGPRKIVESATWKSRFEVDAVMDNMSIHFLREHPWRGAVPNAIPTALTLNKQTWDVDKTVSFLRRFRTTQSLTHIYSYDVSGPTFSANLVSSNSIPLFSVSGSTPAAGDMIYFGFNVRPNHQIVIPIGTAGSFTADIVWEYWNGSAWTDIASVGLFYPGWDPDAMFKATGNHVVGYPGWANWAATTINSVSALWIRARLNSVTTWTTTPVTPANEKIFVPMETYFELENTRIAGDSPPRVAFRFRAMGLKWAGVGPMTHSRILIGAKSRNLSKFTSCLLATDQGLTGDWARTLGTDTTETGSNALPECEYARCSFSTQADWAERFEWYGTGVGDDYHGTYKLFLIGKQNGASVGSVGARLDFYLGGDNVYYPLYRTEPKYTRAYDKTWEVLDFGLMTLPFTRIVSSETVGATDLVIKLFLKRLSGSSTFDPVALVLLPIDEWHVTLDDGLRDLVNASSVMKSGHNLLADMGVVARKSTLSIDGPGPVSGWKMSTGKISIQPATKYRFYVLDMHYDETVGYLEGPLFCSLPDALLVEMYASNSYTSIRGAGS